MTTSTARLFGSDRARYAPPDFRRLPGGAVAVCVLGLLGLAGMFTGPNVVGRVHAGAAGAHSHAIPAGLAQAIHARLGPGPIALGHAPLSAGIEPASGGWKLKASAQSLAARIAPDGMVSAHLAGSGAASLTPLGLSAGGVFARLPTGGALFEAGRLQVRLGPVTGAYQLTAGGLEQRFTINRALSRDARQLTLTFSSPVRWRTIRAGTAIVPNGDADGRLAYAGLRATDAHGRVLRSHFALSARGPEIVTDTKNAAYPVTIDPTWTTTSTPTTTLDLGVESGYATALSEDGTIALVGAEGATYVFQASAEGSWSSSATLVATLADGSDSSDGSADGSSVALSSDGTTALVGSPGADSGLGAAYVFHVSSEGAWASSSTPTATLKNSSGSTSDGFGSSVALSSGGTTALIGADGVNSFAGGAYVFQATAEDAWATSSTPAATLTNSAGSAGDQLGSSVALSSDGSTALIGADGVNSGTGAAYVFQVAAGDALASSPSPNATLTNSAGSEGDGLGSSVALSSAGTTALIGASGVNSGSGAAYVFLAPQGGAWAMSTTPKATLTNGTGVTGDNLGASVSLSSTGTTALIGAVDVGDEATAYVFSIATVSSWASTSSPNAALSNGFSGSGQNLDSSVALSSDGTVALIGAPAADGSAGAAYVFPTSSMSSTPAATLSGPSTAPVGDFGYSVALSSDGTTALVGAQGEAFIFHTATAGSWASSSAVTASLIGSSSDSAAAPVALSADGTTALIGDAGGNGGIGVAYLFHVSSESSWVSSSTPTATLTVDGGFVGGELGSSVSLSSDGTTALVGAPNLQVGPHGGAGGAYVFQASAENAWASAPNTTPTATLAAGSGTMSAELGSSVVLSSDGTIALIGAPGAGGAAYLFQVASETSWTGSITAPTATLTDPSETGAYHFAGSVALSQDGTTALLGDAGAAIAPGAAYVYQVASETSWTGSITAPTATLTEGPNSYGDDLGSSVSMSADGKTALIGANGVDDDNGAAYVYQVSAETGWATTSMPTATVTNGSATFETGDQLGSSVALSPDGTTALIGAFQANGRAGAAYIYSPPSTTYTLTAATNGSGVGTVTSTDNAINCGASCTATYGSGSQVTLNAQAGLNSTFTGWAGGGCSGTGSCVVSVSQDTTVTATFTYAAPPKSLTVTLTGSAGNVTSSPAGISCPGTCAADFTPGTVVTLTATAGSGGTFAGWSGPACQVTITGACSVTTTTPPQSVSATFTTATVLPQEGLSLSLAGTGTGSVSSSPAGISCPGACAADFTQGTVVSLTASPASGTAFAGWSGAGCSGTGACNVSMSAAQAVTATFTATTPKPACTLVPQGAKVTVPAKPTKKHPLAAALKVAARCDESAGVKLTGTITATKKHAKPKTFTIGAVKATVTAGKTDTLTVKLPKSSLTALEAGDRGSVAFTLTATNANGTATATARIGRLKLVKTST